MRKTRLLDIIGISTFTAIMVSIPWERLEGFPFVDRQVYLNHFLHGESIFKYLHFELDLPGFISYFFNEALWEYLVRTLVQTMGVPIDIVFLAISLLCLITFSFFLTQRHNVWSIPLLCNPLLVTFAFDQLRLALAYSLMLIGYMVRRPLISAIFIVFAMFIHTSIIIFVCAYFVIRKLSDVVNRNGSRKFATYAIPCIMGGLVSIAIGPLRSPILGSFGDRRASLVGPLNNSLLYTSFWVGLLGLFALQPKSFLRDEVNAYSAFILAVVSANLLTGGYTLRLLSIGFPMIISSMLSLSFSTRFWAVLFFLIYATFQWLYFCGLMV
ncbi:MAG TPA: EpsG family protein [Steroidobacteraceae bacterium]